MYNPGQEISSLAFDKIIGGALDAVVKAQNNAAMTTVSFVKQVGFTKVNDKEMPVYVDFKYPKEIAPFQPAMKNISVKIESGGKDYIADSTTVKIGSVVIPAVVQVNAKGEITGIEITDDSNIKATKDTKLTLECKKDGNNVGTGAEATLSITSREAVDAKYQDMTLQVPILTMMPIPFIRIDHADIEFNVKINTINTTQEESSSNTKVDSSTTAKFSKWWSPVSASTTLNASFASQKKTSSTEEIKKEFSLNIKVHATQSEMPAGMSRILDILEEAIVAKPLVVAADG